MQREQRACAAAFGARIPARAGRARHGQGQHANACDGYPVPVRTRNAVGRTRPFAQRHHLNPQADSQRALTLLIDGGLAPDTQRDTWQAISEQALAALKAAFEAAAPVSTLRLHGDCHLGNVLRRHQGSNVGPHLVDLDDAMQGPAVQDLWMLVSGDHASMAQPLNTLLAGYEHFSDFDDGVPTLI